MWKIGCSSRVLWELKILDILKFANQIGYDFIELWAEHIGKTLEFKTKVKDITNLSDELGLKLVVHAPFMDLNISSLNHGIREESVRQVSDSFKLAAVLGAEKVVIHPGRMSTSKTSFEDFLEITYNVLSRLIEEAEKYDVVICLENMEKRNKEYFTLPATLSNIIKELSSNHFKVCLDIAHANTACRIQDFITELGDKIFHVHISDNTGHSPVHLPIGEGIIPFREVFIDLRTTINREVTIEGYIPGRCRETALFNLRRLKEILFSL